VYYLPSFDTEIQSLRQHFINILAVRFISNYEPCGWSNQKLPFASKWQLWLLLTYCTCQLKNGLGAEWMRLGLPSQMFIRFHIMKVLCSALNRWKYRLHRHRKKNRTDPPKIITCMNFVASLEDNKHHDTKKKGCVTVGTNLQIILKRSKETQNSYHFSPNSPWSFSDTCDDLLETFNVFQAPIFKSTNYITLFCLFSH